MLRPNSNKRLTMPRSITLTSNLATQILQQHTYLKTCKWDEHKGTSNTRAVLSTNVFVCYSLSPEVNSNSSFLLTVVFLRCTNRSTNKLARLEDFYGGSVNLKAIAGACSCLASACQRACWCFASAC